MGKAPPTKCNVCLRWFYKAPGYCNWCRQAWARCQNDPAWDELGGPPDREWFKREAQRRLANGQPRYPYRKHTNLPEWQLDVWNSGPEEDTHTGGQRPVTHANLLSGGFVPKIEPQDREPMLRLSRDEDGNLTVKYD